jgi:hypothetical protein
MLRGYEGAAGVRCGLPEEVVACDLAHERHLQMCVRIDAAWHHELARGVDDLGTIWCLHAQVSSCQTVRVAAEHLNSSMRHDFGWFLSS